MLSVDKSVLVYVMLETCVHIAGVTRMLKTISMFGSMLRPCGAGVVFKMVHMYMSRMVYNVASHGMRRMLRTPRRTSQWHAHSSAQAATPATAPRHAGVPSPEQATKRLFVPVAALQVEKPCNPQPRTRIRIALAFRPEQPI